MVDYVNNFFSHTFSTENLIFIGTHAALDPVLSPRMPFNIDNLHHFENVGCGELNIKNKNLEGLEKPVGCSELSVEPR